MSPLKLRFDPTNTALLQEHETQNNVLPIVAWNTEVVRQIVWSIYYLLETYTARNLIADRFAEGSR